MLKHLLDSDNKHIYILVGEPRTGKTTLGDLAAIHESSLHLDTDKFTSENLLSGVNSAIGDFLNKPFDRALLISLGRHRHLVEQVMACTRSVQNETTHVTVCRIEKLC